jgi:hypothetical protein
MDPLCSPVVHSNASVQLQSAGHLTATRLAIFKKVF